MMKQILDRCRTMDGLEMADEDIKMTSGDSKASFKSNLKANQNKGTISFETIANSPGGAVSHLPTVTPPNDLILVTDRCNIILLLHRQCTPCQVNLNIATHLRHNF